MSSLDAIMNERIAKKEKLISMNINPYPATVGEVSEVDTVLNNFEENKEDALLTCLQSFKFNKEFTIQLKDFNCFEPRVVFINVLENQLLFQLQKSLVQHIKSNLNVFNQSDDLRGFHPHITIAFRDLKKQIFYKVWEEFKTKNYETSFQSSEIALLKKGNLNWEIYKRFKFTP